MKLPEPKTRIEVEDAEGIVVPARVVSTISSGVLVEWVDSAPPLDGPTTVRWGHQRGLSVLACDLRCDGVYGQLEPSADPLQIQRRRAVRVDINVPVRVVGVEAAGETVNISATGLLVALGLTLEKGETAPLEIDLPDEPGTPLKVSGRVLRNDSGLLGFELLDLSPGQQDRIAHVVFEQQRVALKRRSRDGSPLRLVKEG